MIKDFIIAHLKEIITGAVLLISTIVSVVASVKRGKKNIYEAITDVLPQFIKAAEEIYGSGHGENKLGVVLEYVHQFLQLKFGIDSKQLKKYDSYIKSKVEMILDTPERKKNEK